MFHAAIPIVGTAQTLVVVLLWLPQPARKRNHGSPAVRMRDQLGRASEGSTATPDGVRAALVELHTSRPNIHAFN